jgi:hypothetical protein
MNYQTSLIRGEDTALAVENDRVRENFKYSELKDAELVSAMSGRLKVLRVGQPSFKLRA